MGHVRPARFRKKMRIKSRAVSGLQQQVSIYHPVQNITFWSQQLPRQQIGLTDTTITRFGSYVQDGCQR